MGLKKYINIPPFTQNMDDNETEKREFSSFNKITYRKDDTRYILVKDSYENKNAHNCKDVKVIRLAEWLYKENL